MMKKPRKLKYYRVEWEEIDYGQEVIAAYDKKDAIEQVIGDSGGNINKITADEISQDEYENDL